MTDDELKYWAFLSFSHQDNSVKRPDTKDVSSVCWADWLRDALKTFAIPAELIGQLNGRGELIPERIDPICQNDQALPEDGNLSAGTREALAQSKCLIVICSPRSAKSLRVNEEVRYFKSLGRGNHILPFVVAGEPNASGGNKPGTSPEDECFAPALRHPVKPDGTLDTTRRAGRYIISDARHGVEKREILANDHQNAEADLEAAKLQLIAGLIGVWFGGLWGREQKRRFVGFAQAQNQAREALSQVEETRRQLRAAQAQLSEAKRLNLEAQNRLLEAQNLPREAHSQIQEALNQASEAQNQVREAQQQVQEFQNKARDTQGRLEEAQHRVLIAENKLLEAQNQAGEARRQAEETRRQLQEVQEELQSARRQNLEAQNKVLEAHSPETQNPPREIPAQIEEAQAKVLAAQNQARDAQEQLREFQDQARNTQSQLEEAQSRVLAAETKLSEAQNLASEARQQAEETQRQLREAQEQLLATRQDKQEVPNPAPEAHDPPSEIPGQIEEARAKVLAAQNQAREAQEQLREFQEQARNTQSQLEEAQNRVLAAETKLREAQIQAGESRQQVEETQRQLQEAKNRVQEMLGEIQAARIQAEESRRQIEEVQGQTHKTQEQIQEAQNQAGAAQSKVQEAQNQIQQSRRLARVLALVTLITLLISGVIWWQRKNYSQVSSKPAFEASKTSDLAQGKLDQAHIRLLLQQYSAAPLEENQLRGLDELAARIPLDEIPEALKAASTISDDRQRGRFQKQLLIRLGEVDPLSAMTNAGSIAGKILNDEGSADSSLFFQLAVLDDWLKTNRPAALDWIRQLPDADAQQRALNRIIPALAADNPSNTLTLLNDWKPGEGSYALLFQRWASNNPLEAIQQREQIPGHDADDQILCTILAAWVDRQPEAALNWVRSQPESESKNKVLETCVRELAKTDFPKSLALAESLPEGNWRDAQIAGLFEDWAAADLDAATAACLQLPDGAAKARAWERVLTRRIAKAPASAVEYVQALPPGDYRQMALADLCRRWAEIDTPATLAWAQSLSAEPERIAALNQVVVKWAHQDPQAAMQFANQHPELSGDALGAIAEAWSKNDVAAAMSWLENLPDGPKKDAALLALASSIAERAPTLAAQCCALLTTTQPLTNVVQSIATALSRDDISNAVVWACSQKDEAARRTALSVLSDSWAQADPKGMATYALGLPAGNDQTEYLTAACRQLALRDWPGTVALLQPLSEGELRRIILEQAARACDLSHLAQAAKDIATMPAGDDQQAAIKGLLSSWPDPETAIAWLGSFPESNSQPAQVQSVIKSWAQSEPAAVSKWLANLPAGTASHDMIGAFLEGAIAKYPEFAAQWTQTVTNETQRQKYQVQVARQWIKTDPDAALKWINTLSLPEAVK
jgi:hypothetical protein